MKIEKVTSAGKNGKNEDLVATFHNEGVTDIVIMDGGSSVADRDYIDTDIGDVVWFVRNFALSLEKNLRQDRSQEESVTLALKDLRAGFHAKTAGVPIPLYAYPIAALTWVRILEARNEMTLHIYSLGDCKALLLSADGSVTDLDPYVNPQELVIQNGLSKLTEEGVIDSATRRERLLPMLRARRESQNSTPTPSALCPDPQGPFDARQHTVKAGRGSMLLAMTDGFSRIVDTYEMHSSEEMANLCARNGLEWMMAALRDFEMGGSAVGSLSVKSSDDATAVTCIFS